MTPNAANDDGNSLWNHPLLDTEGESDEGSSSISHQERSGPRLLDRDAAFHQSHGHWGVERICRSSRLRRYSHQFANSRLRTFWDDWFLSLAYKPTLQLLLILFFTYAGMVFFFAYVYLGVSILGTRSAPEPNLGEGSFCDMDITNHMQALYFSLSTMTTIGYGVSDYFFGDCWTPLLLVLWQSSCSIAFQSIAIGLLFQRISRGQKRGKTIIFSDKAVVRRVRGVPHFMFRIGELRRYHLIEVAIRVYCLRHERYNMGGNVDNNDSEVAREIETHHFLTRHVKLLHPNETISTHILMSLPQVIVHKIDDSSPLLPTEGRIWYDGEGKPHHMDTSNNLELESFLRDREAEIVVLVEGIDELTSQPLQARHSYTVQDIEWDHTFAPCAHRYRGPSTERQRNCIRRNNHADPIICSVDFAKFHDTIPASDTDNCPHVPR